VSRTLQSGARMEKMLKRRHGRQQLLPAVLNYLS